MIMMELMGMVGLMRDHLLFNFTTTLCLKFLLKILFDIFIVLNLYVTFLCVRQIANQHFYYMVTNS